MLVKFCSWKKIINVNGKVPAFNLNRSILNVKINQKLAKQPTSEILNFGHVKICYREV